MKTETRYISDQGELSDSQQIAEEMNSYFSSCVGSSNTVMGVVKDPDISLVNARFEFTEIDKETVLHHLTTLNVKKATGVDGISAKLLRMAAPGIATSLTKLFNYSLKTGQIPRDWNATHVTLVHKKDVKELAENYRPVSVLPVVAKVFEAIVHTQLFVY